MMTRLIIGTWALILIASTAMAFTYEAALYDGGVPPYGLSPDCTLEAFNVCSGWIWVVNDVEGAVWGNVFDPNDCPGGCINGGGATDVVIYSRCSSVPGHFGGVGISAVDAKGCRTALLYDSGPITAVHCTASDRWTTVPLPVVHLNGNPFVVTVTWGPSVGGISNPQFALDNGLANIYCSQGGAFGTFPGCAGSTATCTSWTLPPQTSFIYVTDFNRDGTLDDICALYGVPWPLNFPYSYTYSYIPNNLIVSVLIDCFPTTAVEPTSWGRVKSLFD